MAPKLAHSSFALDFLRCLLCAHTTGIARQRDDGAMVVRCPTQEEERRSPCIVARLMGLDAMPAAEEAPARDQQPLRRSRPERSAEGWPRQPSAACCEDAPRPRAIVRRTSSASFRERPAYLRRENDEFLLLCFSPEGDDEKPGSLFTSRSDGDGDDDGAEIAGRRGKRRDDGAKIQRRGRRRPRRRRGYEEAESAPGRSGRPVGCAGECGLQNSSPVSVLDARDGQEESTTTTSTTSSSSMQGVEQAEPCSPSSGEIQPAPRQQQGSRRKLLQPDFDDPGFGLPPPAVSTCSVSKCSDRERRNMRVVNKDEVITPDMTGIWQLICRLLEEDINGSMNWVARSDADIAAEMESESVDQLICEEIGELIQLIKV